MNSQVAIIVILSVDLGTTTKDALAEEVRENLLDSGMSVSSAHAWSEPGAATTTGALASSAASFIGQPPTPPTSIVSQQQF